MKHEISLADAAFSIRPVGIEDAAAIVTLRSDPAQARFVHSISPRVEDQISWLNEYFTRDGDFYFVVERARDHRFEGTIGIYDVADGRAEWGRWFLTPGSLAAPASALLIYTAAFEVLKLSEVYCRTVAENEAVVSFHDSCGLKRAGRLEKAFHLAEGPVDAIEHRLPMADWPSVSAVLASQADRVARLVNRGV